MTTSINNTFFENTATAPYASQIGVATGQGIIFKPFNSIYANTTGSINCTGSTAINSVGGNLSSDNSCGSEFHNIDPLLGPLQNNGGNTDTHMPAPNSPANGAALQTSLDGSITAPIIGQRGEQRPGLDSKYSIGPVEPDSVPPTPIPTPTPTNTPTPTPTNMPTPTPTPTPTKTPTPTPTNTPMPTPTNTPTPTPTPSKTPTKTPTNTPDPASKNIKIFLPVIQK